MEKEMNVLIEKHEDKTGASGKDYTRFKTNAGWMSAFDKDIIAKLKEFEGSTVNLMVAIDAEKGWKNIRAFNGITKAGMPPEEEVKTEKIVTKPKSYQATMWASYAKDIFCAIMEDESKREGTGRETEEYIMKKAIELVKQAQRAFE